MSPALIHSLFHGTATLGPYDLQMMSIRKQPDPGSRLTCPGARRVLSPTMVGQ